MEPVVIPEFNIEMSKIPPALVMNRALPPVLVSKNSVNPPVLVMIVALPAVLAPKNCVPPPLLFVIVALPAVLVFVKRRSPPPLVMEGRFDELLTMPVTVIKSWLVILNE